MKIGADSKALKNKETTVEGEPLDGRFFFS